MRMGPPQSNFGRQEPVASHTLDSFNEDEPLRMARPKLRFQANCNDFRVEIPEFEGKVNPEEFLDWMHTVQHIFEYKEVPEDKKVKYVALRLRIYASVWQTNLCVERVREKKGKIRTWERMKAKLKARFSP